MRSKATLGFLIALSALHAQAGDFDLDDPLLRYAVDTVNQGLKEVSASDAQSCQTDDPKKEEPKKLTPAAQVYTCKFTPQTQDPNIGILRVALYQDDDNLFMGAWKRLPGNHDGNDFGYTSGIGAKVSYVKGKNEFGVDALSGLFSTAVNSGGAKVYYDDPANDVFRRTQRSVDLTRVMASWKHGDTFYIKGAVGIEERNRDPNGSGWSPVNGSDIQQWWHKDILQIHQYDNISSGSQAAIISPTGYQIRPALPAETLQTPISQNSMLVTASVGMKEALFSGMCTVNVEAGASLSTEDNNVVGPNSNVFVNAGIKGDFGKTKSGDPRFEPTLGSAIFLFPTPGVVTGTRVGAMPQGGLLVNFRVAKNGTLLSPFLIMEFPIGRQIFEEFNDHDPIMQVGLRMTFRQH